MKKVIAISMILLTILSTLAMFAPQVKAEPEVITLPAGAWHWGGAIDSNSGLDRIDMDLTLPDDQQVVTVPPGETITFNYWAWVHGWGSGGYEIRQLWFAYSWASSWPPWDAYTGIYDGIPHGTIGVDGSVSITVPTAPGTYKVWLCVESHYSMSQAVAQLTEEPTMLSHACIVVTGAPPSELVSLPAGATNSENGRDTETILLSIDVDSETPGDQQVVTASPGETIAITATFQVWSSGGPGIIKQAFFVYSWTPSWPPSTAYYTPLYNGQPGYHPGVTLTTSFSVPVPQDMGNHYLWFCLGAHYSMELAVNQYTTSLSLPAHAKVIVSELASLPAYGLVICLLLDSHMESSLQWILFQCS